MRRPLPAFLSVVILSGVACRGGSGSEVEIRARVVAQDARNGMPCEVEINSAAQPFYAPVHLQMKTGEHLIYVMAPSEPVPGMYIAIRCKGYESLVRGFDLRPGKNVDLESLVVTPKKGSGG